MNYVQTCIQPDINFDVGSWFDTEVIPEKTIGKLQRKVVCTCYAPIRIYLTYMRSIQLEVTGFSDSDYAGCVDG